MVVQIIDCNLGNVSPLQGIIEKLDLDHVVLQAPQCFRDDEPIIIPGNANTFSQCRALVARGFDKQFFLSMKQPVLGICSGAQVLLDNTEEGGECLGIVSGRSVELPRLRIGWLECDGAFYYFVHRFHMKSPYGNTIGFDGVCSSFRYNNFLGVQFHPEKSGQQGLKFFREWLSE